MLGDTERYDDIDRYLTGQMAPNERESFLKEVESDAALRAHLHLVEDIKGGLERRYEKLDKIQRWQEKRQEEIRKSRNIVRLSTVSVAAAIILGVFISYPTSYVGLQDRGFQAEMKSVLRSSGEFSPIPYWDEKDYDACLIAIQKEIESYKNAMDNLESKMLPDREIRGIMELYAIQADNLKWANIQTLLKMKRYEDSLVAVEEYMSSGGKRKESAVRLHKRLKRKIR